MPKTTSKTSQTNNNQTLARKSDPIKSMASDPARKSISQAQADRQSAKNITTEMIAQRAYYIAMSGYGGSEMDNWLRAERELKGA